MKIPKKLKVLSHEYDVKIVDTADDEKGRDNWGMTNHAKKIIRIDNLLSDSTIEETFIHEMLHVVFHLSGVGTDLDGGQRTTEESVVDKIAPILTSILKDNKIV
jgi:hypothetical protein